MMQREREYSRRNIAVNIVKFSLICFVIFMEYYQFQKSILPSSIKIFEQGIYLILNLSVLTAFNLILSLFFRRWHIVLAISSFVCFTWSILNHYVMLFHGSPLCLSVLRNANAAMDVLKEYNLTFSFKLIYIAVCLGTVAIAIGLLYYLNLNEEPKANVKQRLLCKLSTLVVCATIVYGCLFSGVANLDKIHIGATWNAAIRDYGLLVVVIEDIKNIIDPVEIPEEYDVDKLQSMSSTHMKLGDEKSTPNIVLILNETFSDLKIETDIEYMSPLKEIENTKMGTAIAPMIGGGTNNSEYELLTSNSMYLLKSEAPFNYLNLENNTNNIVQYLECFGYKTTGMHCASETNYSRQKAYPSLGFDNVFLGEDAFEHRGSYGNRKWLDSDNFEDLIVAYKDNVGNPQFLYMLTMQNHGGWEQNENSYDLIHVKGDYGDLTDDLNEYLTSVYMSSQAFAELVEYFANVNEPTIVAMVGDHAPSFANQLTSQGVAKEKIDALTGRTVPYIIWANFDIEYPDFNEYISMTDFVPMIIESAGLPMSTYYQHIRDMQKELPVRLSTGQYVDKMGKIGEYHEDSPYYDMLSKYYFMEYNAIVGEEDFMKALFTPIVVE